MLPDMLSFTDTFSPDESCPSQPTDPQLVVVEIGDVGPRDGGQQPLAPVVVGMDEAGDMVTVAFDLSEDPNDQLV